MSQQFKNKALVVLTKDEARIWSGGLMRDLPPELIEAPKEKASIGHQRITLHQSGHSEDPVTWGYFDLLADSLKGFENILLMSHGHSSSNAAERFEKFTKKNYPEISKRIAGNLDMNLNAITENEMLAYARDWFDNYQRTGLKLSK